MAGNRQRISVSVLQTAPFVSSFLTFVDSIPYFVNKTHLCMRTSRFWRQLYCRPQPYNYWENHHNFPSRQRQPLRTSVVEKDRITAPMV